MIPLLEEEVDDTSPVNIRLFKLIPSIQSDVIC